MLLFPCKGRHWLMTKLYPGIPKRLRRSVSEETLRRSFLSLRSELLVLFSIPELPLHRPKQAQ
jgi:hypothetical protein